MQRVWLTVTYLKSGANVAAIGAEHAENDVRGGRPGAEQWARRHGWKPAGRWTLINAMETRGVDQCIVEPVADGE